MDRRRESPSFHKTGERRPRARAAGQAMVETVIALLFVMIAFLYVLQYVDNLRAKLSLDYAAMRCARARAVGYNDYKLRKTSRLATMATAGECRTRNDAGSPLSTGGMLGRLNTYLSSRNDAEARCILDFDYWDAAVTQDPRVTRSGDEITVRVDQRRPQLFNPLAFSGGEPAASGDMNGAPRLDLSGEFTIEAHYPAYLQ